MKNMRQIRRFDREEAWLVLLIIVFGTLAATFGYWVLGTIGNRFVAEYPEALCRACLSVGGACTGFAIWLAYLLWAFFSRMWGENGTDSF